MAKYRIDVNDILEKTNGGLEIFEHYINSMELQDCLQRKKKFLSPYKEEKTPSATIKKLSGGNYVLACFSSDGKWRNAIAFVQQKENLEYGDAVKLLASRHGIAEAEKIDSMYEAQWSSKEAKPDQPDGEWIFNPIQEVPESWLKIIFSEAVWTHANITQSLKTTGAEERKENTLKYLRKCLVEMHWHGLESYTMVKKRKAMTLSSAEYYPIFKIEETVESEAETSSFSKIYQPKAEKSKRFFYHGKFDPQFLHGLKQAQKEYDQLQKDKDEDEKEDPKLNEVIYLPGPSDALNAYALGYQVVYPSSEYYKLRSNTIKKLKEIAHNILTCPDLDATGQEQNHNLCSNPDDDRFLDIRTIILPEALKSRTDQYQRPCKDLRDYLKYYSAKDFRGLVRTSKAYRFWDMHQAVDKQGNPIFKFGSPVMEYRFSNERIIFFLEQHGFFRHKIGENLEQFIHIDGHIVRIVDESYIKGFLLDFLRNRYFPEHLINLAHRSPALKEDTFKTMKFREAEFKDYGKAEQYFFFRNCIWLTNQAGVHQVDPNKNTRRVWENKIIDKSPKLIKEPMFRIFRNEKSELDIEIYNQDDMFFRFLIQISRIHWRVELEDSLEGWTDEEAEKYRKDHQFDIAGPNLSREQQMEQKLHLINKIYILGYMLHGYRDAGKSWAMFLMDGKVNEDGLSHGGTGKSIMGKALTHFKRTVSFDGRDEDLFKNKHVFENVDKQTDLLFFDDASSSFPFSRLFSMVTGGMTVNEKHVKSSQLKEDETPKVGVTTNFTPDMDQSTLRRLLLGEVCDYYHIEKNGEYNETRAPIDDFGKNLFQDYDENEWNLTINFMVQCVPVFFNNAKIDPPKGNLLNRSLIGAMNINFYQWAVIYFSEEAGRLNKFLPHPVIKEDFIRDTNLKGISSQAFNTKMGYFAQYQGLIRDPKIIPRNKAKRITKTIDNVEFDLRDKKWKKPGGKKTMEFTYLQQPGIDVTDEVYDPIDQYLPLEDFAPGTDKEKLPF